MDIASPQGCYDLYEKSSELAPEVDILINNAGIITYGDFPDVPQEKWEALMQVNLLAPMRLTYNFLPDMIKRGRGHLVFMSSVAGFVATSQGTPVFLLQVRAARVRHGALWGAEEEWGERDECISLVGEDRPAQVTENTGQPRLISCRSRVFLLITLERWSVRLSGASGRISCMSTPVYIPRGPGLFLRLFPWFHARHTESLLEVICP